MYLMPWSLHLEEYHLSHMTEEEGQNFGEADSVEVLFVNSPFQRTGGSNLIAL